MLRADLGIENVRAGLLPLDKVGTVRERWVQGAGVVDGVNDAPALAAAHTDLAMGQGPVIDHAAQPPR